MKHPKDYIWGEIENDPDEEGINPDTDRDSLQIYEDEEWEDEDEEDGDDDESFD